jgi:ankyrin repeat protein
MNGPLSAELKDAIGRDDRGKISELLKTGESVEHALGFAVNGSHLGAAEFLLAQGADVNYVFPSSVNIDRDVFDDTTSHLIDAVLRGSNDGVGFLLEHGANPNFTGSFSGTTALWMATRYRRPEMVRLLLEHGANVNARESWSDESSLDTAAQHGYPEILELLLRYKARATFRHVTFSITGSETNLEISRMLLDGGADVNEREVWGRTPLMWATDLAPLETVRFLIERGADINAVSGPFGNRTESNNETALQLARRKNREEIVSLLLSLGARTVPSRYEANRSIRARIKRLLRL